jgi:hypothetical protein
MVLNEDRKGVLRLRRGRGYAQHEREIFRLCGPRPFALSVP